MIASQHHHQIKGIVLAALLSVFFVFASALSPAVNPAWAVPILKGSSKRPAGAIVKKVQPAAPIKKLTESAKHSNPVATANPNNRIAKQISAKSAIIIDGKNGKTLYSKNPDAPRQPASTIKVLTGTIALGTLQDNDKVPVSSKAAKQPRSKVYLDQRRKYVADDLINAVLLASANDASVALAEKIAGTEATFAKMMTLKAKLWGARHTVCKTATGLTAKGQKSTARDLAIIFRQAMKNPEFAERMKQVKAVTTDGKVLRNHNKALWQVTGTQGGKTGYTNAARQTYVGKFKRGSDEIVVAIMGSESMWDDLKKLVQYGFRQEKLARQEKAAQTGRMELAQNTP